MIACFAWTNLQIINMTNARINLYAEEKADLFIRMGPHISGELVEAVRSSGIYEHVYSFDPVVLSYRNMKLGWIPGFKVFLLRGEFRKAYDALLEELCGRQKYSRALVTWFYVDNVFVLDYWKRHADSFAITLVEEGTGTYFYSKKDLAFPMFMGKCLKDRIRRKVTEGPLARVLRKDIDSICMYRPEYSQKDVDYRKLQLPRISQTENAEVYQLLCAATKSVARSNLDRYENSRAIYFSLFSQEGPEYDATSLEILTALIEAFPSGQVAAKIHTGDPVHAGNFALEVENRVFTDRQVYIFEGLYAQMHERSRKLLVSCISSAAINPKFMFGEEPTVIFTYRLYHDYKTRPILGDDWIAAALLDAYSDKSRVMIPDSMEELKQILERLSFHQDSKE